MSLAPLDADDALNILRDTFSAPIDAGGTELLFRFEAVEDVGWANMVLRIRRGGVIETESQWVPVLPRGCAVSRERYEAFAQGLRDALPVLFRGRVDADPGRLFRDDVLPNGMLATREEFARAMVGSSGADEAAHGDAGARISETWAAKTHRQRLEEMVALVESYPLCEITTPARFGAALTEQEIRQMSDAAGIEVPPGLIRFYSQMNGFSFSWRAPRDTPDQERLIEQYNASTGHLARMDWGSNHGIRIVPLEELLHPTDFGELRLAEGPDIVIPGLAGQGLSGTDVLDRTRPFDRHQWYGSEDGCVGLLLLPGAEARVVGITDSGLVDPRRPWMELDGYLDLVIATGGEFGARSELYEMTSAPPWPRQLQFTLEQLSGFRRGVFRSLGPV